MTHLRVVNWILLFVPLRGVTKIKEFTLFRHWMNISPSPCGALRQNGTKTKEKVIQI